MSNNAVSVFKRIFSFFTLDPYVETSISEKISVSYRCSKCGRQNETMTWVSQKGTAWLPKVYSPNVNYIQEKDIAITSAHVSTLNQYNKKKQIIQTGSISRAARKAGVSCSCEMCGNKEPWAKMDFHIGVPTAVIAGVLFLVIALFGSNLFGWHEVLYLFIGYLGCVAIAFLAEGIVYWIRSAQIKRLPKESLPSFVFQEESE